MKDKKSSGSVVSIGVVSLITVFVVLMLTSFSVLIIASSGADLDLANKTAVAIDKYYEADSKAEEILKELDTIRQNEDVPIYKLDEIEVTEISNDENGVTVSFIIEIDSKKQLEVDVLLPNDKKQNIIRLRWQTIAIETLIL